MRDGVATTISSIDLSGVQKGIKSDCFLYIISQHCQRQNWKNVFKNGNEMERRILCNLKWQDWTLKRYNSSIWKSTQILTQHTTLASALLRPIFLTNFWIKKILFNPFTGCFLVDLLVRETCNVPYILHFPNTLCPYDLKLQKLNIFRNSSYTHYYGEWIIFCDNPLIWAHSLSRSLAPNK